MLKNKVRLYCNKCGKTRVHQRFKGKDQEFICSICGEYKTTRGVY